MMAFAEAAQSRWVVCGREGEKGVLATSELVDRGSWHTDRPEGVLCGWPRSPLAYNFHTRTGSGEASCEVV
jgi:hypothetical protein